MNENTLFTLVMVAAAGVFALWIAEGVYRIVEYYKRKKQ